MSLSLGNDEKPDKTEISPWPVLTVQNFCSPLAKAPKKFDYYLMLFFQFLNSALPRLQIDFSWGVIMNNIPLTFIQANVGQMYWIFFSTKGL